LFRQSKTFKGIAAAGFGGIVGGKEKGKIRFEEGNKPTQVIQL
jgi:hypothetical protein